MRASDISAPIVRLVDQLLAGRLRGLLPEEKRYWFFVPLTGLAAGLISVFFVEFLDWVQRISWGTDDDVRNVVRGLPALQRFLVPLCGGVLIAAALGFQRRDAPTEGTAGLMETLAVGRGRVPFLRNLMAAFTSLTAVGTGASLGREGALIQAGAGCGSWIGRTFHLREHHVKVLLACGAAGGMAAVYNSPIGASVFAMEVLLGSLALDLFGPIIISAVVSTAVMRYFLGAEHVYTIEGGPLFEKVLEEGSLLEPLTVGGWEILLTLLLGALLGLASAAFIRVFSGVHDLFRWLDPLRWTRPLAVMVLLALLGLAWPVVFSDIIGNGSDTVDAILSGEFARENTGAALVRYLIFLALLKVLATALCRAARIPGGLFTPSMLVGALLGLGFGLLVNQWFPGIRGPPESYALVAMGAMVAGTMHAPITAVLMVFEMTKDYGLVLPLMSACIASAVISRISLRGSLFTEPLRRKGIQLPETASPAWFKEPRVRQFLCETAPTVGAATPFQKVMEAFLRTPKENDRIYVVDDNGKYLGVVSLHEIKTFVQEMEHLETVIAADIVNPYFPTVSVDAPMSEAVEILAESDAERLPVLDNGSSRKLLGSVSKRDLLLSYREANIARVKRTPG